VSERETSATPPPDRGDRKAQVAWKAIEEDAEVFSAEGERVGRVSRTVGDSDADVFTGLAIVIDTFGGERFVDAERVRGIWPDRVDLDLTKDRIDRLPKYEDVPSVRWRPGALGGIFSRLFGGRRRP
jgi:hypothetical protein